MSRYTEAAASGTARWEHESSDGSILAVFAVTFTREPYDPGYISGPPELCYPPEGGEIEITDLELVDWQRWTGEDSAWTEHFADLSPEDRATITRRYHERIEKEPALARNVMDACERAYQENPGRFRDFGPED